MNKKIVMFTLLLFVFISSITVVSAVDVSDNVTSTDIQASTVETISVDEQQVDEYNNIESNVNEIQKISNDKSVKSLNSGVIHTINNESYSTYFTNGILNNAAQDGDVILIDDIFEGSSFIFDKSINLTSTQNAILRNCIITFNSNADYSNVTNLNIVNIDDNAHDGINVYSATNMTIEDNTIYIDSNNTAKGITLNNADGTIIYNNDITVNAYTNEVTYYYEENYANPAGTVETAGIGVYNSSYTNVESNTVSMSSTGYHPQRGTLVGIAVQGNIVTKSSLSLYPVGVFYNTVKNNIVNLDGDLYAYGITLQYYALYNMITNNTITADSSTKFYVCGIQASYLVQYNQIYDNKINLTALNFTYGINSQGLPGYNGHNYYNNNRINLSSKFTRGIESFNGIYENITYNVILVDGDYSNGIGLGGIYGNNITYNVINSTGTIFTINTSTADDIPFLTDGIYVNSSHYYDNNGILQTNLSLYNNIKNNYILTNGVYAIDLYGYNNTITYNYINSSSKHGSFAIYKNTNGSNKFSPNYAYTTPNFLNNRILLLKNNKLQTTLKSDGFNENGITTHVITNDNWGTYLSSEGLSNQVSDNDVLDFQGEISIDHDIKIDKPVNITSTTNNGKISSAGNVFEINNKGSYSNLTNICLYNTQLILNGADYININHINVTNENLELGSGKGVTSIREGCDFINVTNSYFYVSNNGGHSNFVLAGAGFVNVDNNTIHSEGGMVGNVVYLNFYNVENQTSQFINITNNNIIGPTNPAQICWLIGLNAGNDVLIKGNNLTYTGDGIINGVPNLRIEDNNFNNVTNIQLWTDAEIINNRGIHNFEVTGAKLVTGNEINGNFVVYGQKDLIISNNVIKTYNDDNLYNNKIFSEKFVCENNTIDAVLPLKIDGSHGSLIQNNTITTTADYSIYLTNSSANTIRNNTLIASVTGGSSVYGPGDYIENNIPTSITEYTASNFEELDEVFAQITECETDEAVIYLEDYEYHQYDLCFLEAPNKIVTIDGSRLNNSGCDFDIDYHFVEVVEGTLILKNLKIDININPDEVDDGFNCYDEGNIIFENCFININAPEMYMIGFQPQNPFIRIGNGYVSIKSCTIIYNYDWYTTLTTGNEVYIVDSIILGSNIKPYDADNMPETLEVRQNYINSYDKNKYSYVKDEIVAMVNGAVDLKNTIQVSGNEKTVLKLVVSEDNKYDNITNQLGYESGVFLGSTNEEVINTTGLIFNKSNNYTITLDENPVDETVTLYAYVLSEKKLMDVVNFMPTEKTIININLSTLTPAADNQIIINITDVDGNLIQTSGLINVSVNGGESTTFYFMNGKLTIPYKITSPDDLTIYAVFSGDNQYSRSNTTTIITPVLTDTELLVKVLNNTYGNVTIEVSVKAEDNFVEEGIITVDGVEYNIAAETTIVSVQVPISGANVTVTYNGSLFNRKSSTVVEIIPDIPTNVIMSVQTETKVNNTIPVTIILTADDNLLTGQEVTISTITGDETINLTKGVIIYQYTPTTVGEETITVTFNSKDRYLASSANTTITVTEDKDAIIQELNNTVQEQTETIDELNNTVNSQDKTIQELEQNMTEANSKIDSLNNNVTKLNNQVKDLTNENKQLKDNLTQANNKIATQDKTIQDLNKSNNDLNNNLADANKKIDSLTKQNADLEKQLADLNKKVDALTKTVDNLNKTVAARDATIKELTTKVATKITVSKINTTTYTGKVTVTGKVTDNNGKALNNMPVSIKINTGTTKVVTNANGVYTYTTTAWSVGTSNVTVSSIANDKYTSSTAKTTFKVSKAKPVLKINSISAVKYKDKVTVTGSLIDNNNKAINGAQITLKINSKSVTVKTGKDGSFTYTTSATSMGTNNITATYNGNTKYNKVTSKTTFKVNKQNLILTVDRVASGLKYKDPLVVGGRLVDGNAKAVANTQVSLKFNGKTYKAKTDKNGYYKVATRATTMDKNNLTVTYAGNKYYNKATAKTTFTVAKQDLVITFNTVKYSNGKVTISGTFTDRNRHALMNSLARITLNGKQGTAKTDKTGTFTYTTKASKGTYKVTLAYPGNARYNAYSKTSTVSTA